MSRRTNSHRPKHGHTYPMVMQDGTIQELYYWRGVYFNSLGKPVTDDVEIWWEIPRTWGKI